MLLLIYVDDVIITSSSEQNITTLPQSLNLIFSLKDPGNLNLTGNRCYKELKETDSNSVEVYTRFT